LYRKKKKRLEPCLTCLVGQAYEVVEGVQELNLGPQQSSKSQVCLFILRKVNTKPVIVDFKTKFIE
jgi:hypothetical protein